MYTQDSVIFHGQMHKIDLVTVFDAILMSRQTREKFL